MSNQPSQLAITASALLGFAIGNRTACSNAISQAKEALSIKDIHGKIKDTRSLTDEDKARIVELWQNQYNATDDKQTDFVELVESIAAPAINEPIETTTIPTSQTDLTPVEIDVNRIKKQVENFADDSPLTEREKKLIRENFMLQSKLILLDYKNAPTYPDNETVRLTVKHKQIALKGAYLNALMLATGIDKPNVKTWLESSVIDSKNVTESVKLLIVTELKNQLIKARDVTK